MTKDANTDELDNIIADITSREWRWHQIFESLRYQADNQAAAYIGPDKEWQEQLGKIADHMRGMAAILKKRNI